jgi:uncharacterized HAD superfamily protein
MKKLRIMLDIDGTITHAPQFFAEFSQRFQDIAEIHVVTARRPDRDKDESPNTAEELAAWGIHYDHLVFTCEKAVYCIEKKINIVFEDTDEFYQNLPKEVLVFKIREEWNFDWQSKRWVYDDKTGVHIEDLH